MKRCEGKSSETGLELSPTSVDCSLAGFVLAAITLSITSRVIILSAVTDLLSASLGLRLVHNEPFFFSASTKRLAEIRRICKINKRGINLNVLASCRRQPKNCAQHSKIIEELFILSQNFSQYSAMSRFRGIKSSRTKQHCLLFSIHSY